MVLPHSLKETRFGRIFAQCLMKIVIMLLYHRAMKAQTIKCTRNDGLHIQHQWYKAGDLLIDGMVSHIHYVFPRFSFTQNPTQESFQISLEALQYEGLVQLLLHFIWKWAGLLTIDDEAGEHFSRTLEQKLLQNRICL
ncbi:hypothetical protein E2320_003464, partial [Naja naja]